VSDTAALLLFLTRRVDKIEDRLAGRRIDKIEDHLADIQQALNGARTLLKYARFHSSASEVDDVKRWISEVDEFLARTARHGT